MHCVPGPSHACHANDTRVPEIPIQTRLPLLYPTPTSTLSNPRAPRARAPSTPAGRLLPSQPLSPMLQFPLHAHDLILGIDGRASAAAATAATARPPARPFVSAGPRRSAFATWVGRGGGGGAATHARKLRHLRHAQSTQGRLFVRLACSCVLPAEAGVHLGCCECFHGIWLSIMCVPVDVRRAAPP